MHIPFLIGLSGIFDDHFITHLFNLVEETRALDDEDTFNYAVIKLLVGTGNETIQSKV